MTTARAPLASIWPSLAAGVSALLGMSSCTVGLVPMDWLLVGAPLIALAVTGLLFRVILPLGPVAPDPQARRSGLRVAALVGWIVTAVTCRVVGRWYEGKLTLPTELALPLVFTLGGIVLGAAVALIVLRAGESAASLVQQRG